MFKKDTDNVMPESFNSWNVIRRFMPITISDIVSFADWLANFITTATLVLKAVISIIILVIFYMLYNFIHKQLR